ncbi:MAG: hypothetical protein J3R72DRAFT_431198 [Linnemannia gamsii]|nr:MAG: hypothetical protein J3R72DRAFT_431198 [Linnemannia gamsii]
MLSPKRFKSLDANQQPRNMLRRLSTMARDVIKRRSSVQLLTQGSSPISETTETTMTSKSAPTTPTTTSSASTLNSKYSEKPDTLLPPSSTTSPTTPVTMPDSAVIALGITDNDLLIDTVTKPASIPETTSPLLEKVLPMIPSSSSTDAPSSSPTSPLSPQEPATPIADTFLATPHLKQLHHCPSSTSELSSNDTLSIPSSDSLVSSSSTSVHSKTSSTSVETIITTQEVLKRSNTTNNNANNTLIRQKFLDDKEARKATLRVGTSEIIQAKAQSLQSPSFTSRASAESLKRGVSPTKTESDKPPVKSLISFWEQVSDPLDM